MEKELIGRRAQDIQAGLRDVEDSRVAATVPISRQIGMAAQLAVHLRGIEVIENIVAFYGFCANLGISSDSLPMVLRTLEEIGWIRVAPNHYAPKRIETSIPFFQELYATLGSQWSQRLPSELEQATMAIIDRLSVAPAPMESIASDLGIAAVDLQTIIDIGDLGGYLRLYESPRDKIPIVYAPSFMEENPETVLNFLAKRPDAHERVQALLKAARSAPGTPINRLGEADPLIVELVNENVLRAPAIVSSGGQQSFVFAPFKTTHPRGILEKARIILACVRYGQGYSSITTISDPSAILRSLRDRKLIGRVPHSNIQSQYAAAANMGVGFIEPENGRYRFRMYDTEDNNAAVDLAIAMCHGATEDVVSPLLSPADVRVQLSAGGPGGLILPEANRLNARNQIKKRQLDPSTQTAARLGQELLDDLRGIHRVV